MTESAPTDAVLLAGWVNHRREADFHALVARYARLVHHAAGRVCGDDALAAEAAQLTFILLVRKAGSLTSRASLAGWLHLAAVGEARHLVRKEGREARKRQLLNEAMKTASTPPPPVCLWEEMQPVLDAALAALSEKDREALLLRFYRSMSAGEAGAALGIAAPAAQKRMERALERLRVQLERRRGIQTGGSLAAAMTAGFAADAGAALPSASLLASNALAAGAAGSGALTGLFSFITAVMKIKLAVPLAAVVLASLWPVASRSVRSFTEEGPSPAAGEGAVPTAEEARTRSGFRARLASSFAARMGEISKIESRRDRHDAWLRLADEAYRTSADAAREVLAAAGADQGDPDGRLSGLLMLFMGLSSDTRPEFQRLRALCHGEALTDLKSSREYSSRPDLRRSLALHSFALYDPEEAVKFVSSTPESWDDAMSVYALVEYSRPFNTYLNGLLEASVKHPKLLESWCLQGPQHMPPETQMRVAARLAPAAVESDRVRLILSRFYAQAGPEARRWLEENAPMQTAGMIAGEKLLEQGLVPDTFAQSPAEMLTPQWRRANPLTEAQAAALVTAAAKAGEAKRVMDESGRILSQTADPAALLQAIPGIPETAGITGELYRSWATYDAVGLSAALAESRLPHSDRGIEALVQSQREDPQAQLVWAQKISDSAARQRVLQPLLKRHAKALPDLVRGIAIQQGYSAAP